MILASPEKCFINIIKNSKLNYNALSTATTGEKKKAAVVQCEVTDEMLISDPILDPTRISVSAMKLALRKYENSLSHI